MSISMRWQLRREAGGEHSRARASERVWGVCPSLWYISTYAENSSKCGRWFWRADLTPHSSSRHKPSSSRLFCPTHSSTIHQPTDTVATPPHPASAIGNDQRSTARHTEGNRRREKLHTRHQLLILSIIIIGHVKSRSGG